MEETEIVRRLQAQDESVLVDFMTAYGDFIGQVINYNLRDSYSRQFFEDIENRCFYQIWSKIGSYNASKGEFKAWLGTVVKYQTIDYKRGLRASLRDMEIDDSFIATHETPASHDEIDLEPIFKLLTPTERQVFDLYFNEDLYPEEISKKLQMSTNAVYTNLSRGRKKIKEADVRWQF